MSVQVKNKKKPSENTKNWPIDQIIYQTTKTTH